MYVFFSNFFFKVYYSHCHNRFNYLLRDYNDPESFLNLKNLLNRYIEISTYEVFKAIAIDMNLNLWFIVSGVIDVRLLGIQEDTLGVLQRAMIKLLKIQDHQLEIHRAQQIKNIQGSLFRGTKTAC